MRSPILAFVVLIAALLGKIQAASAQSPASLAARGAGWMRPAKAVTRSYPINTAVRN
jgi:hypothetical protein